MQQDHITAGWPPAALDKGAANRSRRPRALLAGLLVAVLLAAVPAPGTLHLSVPDTAPTWSQSGRISWYGPGFQGRRTANGETFDTRQFTMAHRSLAFGSRVRVTNLDNGRTIVLRVNDRGPYVRGRIADLSHAAAARLGFVDDGVTHARIELL